LSHRQIIVKGNASLIAFSSPADDLITLHIVTGANTSVTHDTGIVIYLDHCGGRITSVVRGARWKTRRRNALLLGEIKQQIALPGVARGTPRLSVVSLGVVCHEQLSKHRSRPYDFVALRLYHHAILSLPDTGGLENACALHVHHAHTAHSHRLELGGMTEDGEVNPSLLGRLIQRGTQGYLYRHTVDGHR
jgi:hypothetical protein